MDNEQGQEEDMVYINTISTDFARHNILMVLQVRRQVARAIIFIFFFHDNIPFIAK